MTIRTTTRERRFQVIDGGRVPGAPAPVPLSLPEPPVMSASELAAEMAELYALSLLRDVPFAAMADPHHVVRVDATTRFTLHELLCELRSLSWFDGGTFSARGPVVLAAHGSRAADGEADHRRELRLNGDGQLTLRTLFRGVVSGGASDLRFSAFHASDCLTGEAPESCPRPATDAPLSSWVRYVERSAGAGLGRPGADDVSVLSWRTPRGLAEDMRASHPCRTFYSAALMLLARGSAFDPGLNGPAGGPPGVNGQTVLSSMAETAERAFDAAMRRHSRAGRLSRPAVFAARFAAMAGLDDPAGGGNDTILAALDELTRHAPNLMTWVARRNAAAKPPACSGESLLLPVMPGDDVMPHRADCAAQGVIAGAMATLLKALFDTRRHARLRMVGVPGGGIDIGAEADRLAADIALSRSVSGGWFQAENHQDLRLGEALAIQTIRLHFEAARTNLSLGFTDFDGRAVTVSAHPGALGAGHASLRIDGRLAPWPLEQSRTAAHLAVV
ncbi:bromoperoxidase [Salipiger sp.]|uniref:bromoperoxidase n=1 Tax=Salipiger sp. TaxID=2078585 RepID=UPI003A969B7E